MNLAQTVYYYILREDIFPRILTISTCFEIHLLKNAYGVKTTFQILRFFDGRKNTVKYKGHL